MLLASDLDFAMTFTSSSGDHRPELSSVAECPEDFFGLADESRDSAHVRLRGKNMISVWGSYGSRVAAKSPITCHMRAGNTPSAALGFAEAPILSHSEWSKSASLSKAASALCRMAWSQWPARINASDAESFAIASVALSRGPPAPRGARTSRRPR
jgi:hypothetical protein